MEIGSLANPAAFDAEPTPGGPAEAGQDGRAASATL
jgi:hypothetical protein